MVVRSWLLCVLIARSSWPSSYPLAFTARAKSVRIALLRPMARSRARTSFSFILVLPVLWFLVLSLGQQHSRTGQDEGDVVRGGIVHLTPP